MIPLASQISAAGALTGPLRLGEFSSRGRDASMKFAETLQYRVMTARDSRMAINLTERLSRSRRVHNGERPVRGTETECVPFQGVHRR